MLGYFVPVGDDELLFSALSRLRRRLADLSDGRFSRLAFGNSTVGSHVLFQQNVDALLSSLPVGANWTADDLIWGHMLTPFYSPFLRQDSLTAAVKALRNGGAGVPLYLSARTATVASGKLRCCEQCYREDIARLGEPAWRRAHQCPPVLVCPHHGSPLLETSVAVASRRRATLHGSWVALTEDILTESSVLELPAGHAVCQDLAERCLWLLRARLAPHSRPHLARRFGTLARAGGWTNGRGRADWRAIGQAVESFYGSEFLTRLGLDPDVIPASRWVKAIAAPNDRGSDPIRRLLLLAFFDCAMEDFFAESITPERVRAANLVSDSGPCKNVFCPQKDIYTPPQGLIGRTEVRCPECGFRYRFGPGGRYASQIIDPGELWIERVQELRLRGKPWNEIQVTTHLSHSGMWRLIDRLGDRLNPEPLRRKAAVALRQDQEGERRRRYRSWLVETVRRDQTLIRQELTALDPSAVSWLRDKDREWFEEHAPPVQRMDWPARDQRLLEDIAIAFKDITEQQPPVRASKSLLVEMVDGGWALQKRKGKVPRALELWEQLAESSEAFAERFSRVGPGA